MINSSWHHPDPSLGIHPAAAGADHPQRGADFPEGDYFAWIACESGIAKRLRSILVEERGANRKWVRAHGY